MDKKVIKCSECEHCIGRRPNGNRSKSFWCYHPDQEHISKYYKEHKVTKAEGFIGFGKAWDEEVPVKTSPGWCPKKKE